MATNVRAFFHKHKIILIIFISAFVLASIALAFLLPTRKTTHALKKEALKSVYLTPKTIYLPKEPLSRSEIEFSRKQKKTWDEKDFEEWYEQPSMEEIEALKKKNRQTLEALLKEVP